MAILRPASGALALALQNGVQLWSADLFTFTLIDGTVLRWTSWDSNLTVGGNVFSCQAPWLSRSKWSVTNTMVVPSMTVDLRALNDNFNGGTNVKLQIHNGLFDGASFLLERVYMPTPGDVTTLGKVGIFGGVVGAVQIVGNKASLTVKGKNNLLDQSAPRNVYQSGCLHAFCDPGCTLLRASFTTTYTMGGSPTPTFLPWAAAPGSPGKYLHGSVQVTSGAASGQWRNIEAVDGTGLTLAYPLYETPNAGDTFTAFEGCDKTLNSGSGQSCADRNNKQNFYAFPFLPPPAAAM